MGELCVTELRNVYEYDRPFMRKLKVFLVFWFLLTLIFAIPWVSDFDYLCRSYWVSLIVLYIYISLRDRKVRVEQPIIIRFLHDKVEIIRDNCEKTPMKKYREKYSLSYSDISIDIMDNSSLVGISIKSTSPIEYDLTYYKNGQLEDKVKHKKRKSLFINIKGEDINSIQKELEYYLRKPIKIIKGASK